MKARIYVNLLAMTNDQQAYQVQLRRSDYDWYKKKRTSGTPLAFYDLGRMLHGHMMLKYYGYLVQCLL